MSPRMKRMGLLLSLLMCAVAPACGHTPEASYRGDTVGALAYDKRVGQAHRVYLQEDGRLVPFLALRNNADHTTLLVREFLLSDLMPYSDSAQPYSSYYAGSNVDRYLCDTYISSFSEDICGLIATSAIEIASLEGLKSRKRIAETIQRKVFLLSANEANCAFGSLHCKEGSGLEYFHGAERMKAYDESGNAQTWYLRTAVVTEDNAFISVSYDGSAGVGAIRSAAGQSVCGVRPALCLPSSTGLLAARDPDGEGLIYTIDTQNNSWRTNE